MKGLSNRQKKKLRKAKTCTSKKRFSTPQEAVRRAKELEMYHYSCPVCYGYHLTSSPGKNELEDIMKDYK